MLPESEPRVGLISTDDDFSRSNDERDFPKYRNIKFDFCVDDSEMFESDGEGANVKLSCCASLASSGLFLCLISEVKTIRMMTAKVAPVPIATSKRSPCDSPSIETFGTESRVERFIIHIIKSSSAFKINSVACFQFECAFSLVQTITVSIKIF